MVAHRLATLAAAAAAAAVLVPSGTLGAELKACSGDKNDLNDLLGIPRVNFAMESVPRDLGQYESPMTTCETGGELEICQADWLDDFSTEGPQLIVDKEYASAHEDSWINYAQSVAIYAVIGVAFALITIIAAFVALIVNCCGCCTCCCRRRGEAKFMEDGSPAYPRWQILTTYFCLFFFFILVLTFTLLILVRGNMGLTEAQLAMVDAPDALAALTTSVSSPVIGFATKLIGTTGVNMITNVNETLFDVGELAQVHISIGCAREIFDNVTDPNLLTGVVTVLDDIEDLFSSLPTEANVAQATDDMIAQITDIENAVTTASSQFSDFSDGINTILALDLDTQIATINTDMGAIESDLQDVEDGVDAYIALSNAADALNSDITSLLDNSNDYTIAMVTDFQASFATFDNLVRNLSPDEDDLTASIGSLNTGLSTLDSRLSDLETDLGTADTTVDNMPTITDLNGALGGIVTAIDNFDLTGLETQLQDLLNVFDALPNVQPIVDTINSIIALQDKIPCIFAISDVPQNINDNLIELPADLLNATSQLEDLNNTFTDATAELPALLDDIDGFSQSFNGTTQALGDEFEAQMADANLLLADLRTAITDLQTQITTELDSDILSLDSAITSVGNARSAITSSNMPSASTSDDIDDASAARTAMISALDALAGTTFSVDVQAVVDYGSPNSWNCKSGGPCYTLGNNPRISSCSSSTCYYPHEYWASLQSSLGAFVTAMGDISPSLADLKIQIDAAQASISGLTLNCCTDFSTFQDTADDMSAASDALTDATASIGTLKEDAADISSSFSELLADQTSFNSVLTDMRTTVDDINATLASLADSAFTTLFDMEQDIYELLTIDLGDILDEIKTARLDAIAAAPLGFENLIMHVAEQFDRVIAAVEPSQATLASSVGDILDIARIVDTSRDQDGSLREIGSIYYLSRVGLEAMGDGSSSPYKDASFFDAYETPTVLGALVDGQVVAYPDDATCVTDTCIKNTIELYNNGKLSSVLPEDVSTALPVQLSISRTAITAVPSVVPAVLLVMAVAICFLPSCGYGLACCSVCVAPWLFAIFGGLFFPFLIITADVCASAESVGATVMSELQPYLCEQINGTINAGGFCEVYLDAPGIAKTVELDTPEMLLSMLNQCSGSSLANVEGAEAAEPIEALYASFGLEASIIVQNQLINLLDDILPGMGIVLRGDLRADIENSGSDLEGNVEQFASDLEDVLGCEDISAAYLGFKETFCCDFGQAFYWSFAGWYLLAFCMLLLGLPLGCMAAKRLKDLQRSRAILRSFYNDSSAAVANTRFGTAVSNSRLGSAVSNSRFGRSVFVAAPADAAEADASVAPYATVYNDGSSAAAEEVSGTRGTSKFAAVGASFRDRFKRGKKDSSAVADAESDDEESSDDVEGDARPSRADRMRAVFSSVKNLRKR